MKVTANHILMWRDMRQRSAWFCVTEIVQATGCTRCTVQRYIKFLAEIGLLDIANTYPAPHYKLVNYKTRPEGNNYLQAISVLAGVLD